MKVGDLVKGYQGRKDGYTSHSYVYADGRNLRFESWDVKAVK